MHGIPLGLQPIEHHIAYLRQALGLGNISFYQDNIPNGMKNSIFNIVKMPNSKN
jgi:hypothetical protein